jgi:tripartite-type tricarboxylate transporter receptor subunit TctC
MKSFVPLLLAGLLSAAVSVQAQEPWPNKPVLVINPWASGGPAEAIIRPIAEKLSQRLGTPHTVQELHEDRSGPARP